MKNLQLYRNGEVLVDLAAAKSALTSTTMLANLTADTVDGMPILARYYADDAKTTVKTLLGLAYKKGDSKSVTIVGDASAYVKEVTVNGSTEGYVSATTETDGTKIDITLNGENLFIIGDGDVAAIPHTYVNTYFAPSAVTTTDTIASGMLQIEENIDALASAVGRDLVYNKEDKRIKIKDASGNTIGEGIDTTDFIKDGMISSITYTEVDHTLHISWNTDAGIDVTSISLSGLVDIYDTDNLHVGSAFTTTAYPEELEGAESIATSDTTSVALNKVEKTISALTQEVLDNEEVTEKAVQALADAAGTVDADGNITYVQNESANYISTATSLANADDILDAAIKTLSSKVESNTTDEVKVGPKFREGGSSAEYDETFKIGDAEPKVIATGDTTSVALQTLEDNLVAVVDEIVKNELVAEKAVQALAKAAGTVKSDGTIEYVADTTAKYISGATSLTEADKLLDAAIAKLSEKDHNTVSVSDDGSADHIVVTPTTVDNHTDYKIGVKFDFGTW